MGPVVQPIIRKYITIFDTSSVPIKAQFLPLLATSSSSQGNVPFVRFLTRYNQRASSLNEMAGRQDAAGTSQSIELVRREIVNWQQIVDFKSSGRGLSEQEEEFLSDIAIACQHVNDSLDNLVEGMKAWRAGDPATRGEASRRYRNVDGFHVDDKEKASDDQGESDVAPRPARPAVESDLVGVESPYPVLYLAELASLVSKNTAAAVKKYNIAVKHFNRAGPHNQGTRDQVARLLGSVGNCAQSEPSSELVDVLSDAVECVKGRTKALLTKEKGKSADRVRVDDQLEPDGRAGLVQALGPVVLAISIPSRRRFQAEYNDMPALCDALRAVDLDEVGRKSGSSLGGALFRVIEGGRQAAPIQVVGSFYAWECSYAEDQRKYLAQARLVEELVASWNGELLESVLRNAGNTCGYFVAGSQVVLCKRLAELDPELRLLRTADHGLSAGMSLERMDATDGVGKIFREHNDGAVRDIFRVFSTTDDPAEFNLVKAEINKVYPHHRVRSMESPAEDESDAGPDSSVSRGEDYRPNVLILASWPNSEDAGYRGFKRIAGGGSYDELPEALAGIGLHGLYERISEGLEKERESAYQIRVKLKNKSIDEARPPIINEGGLEVMLSSSSERLPTEEGEPEGWLDKMMVSLVLHEEAVESVNARVLETLAQRKSECYFIQAGTFIALSASREFDEYDSMIQAMLRIAAYEENARSLAPASGSDHVGKIVRISHRMLKDEFKVTPAPIKNKDIGWVTDLVAKFTNRNAYVEK
ncbi:hypothetical protein [Amycolatopsis sp. H20-H5]|uniref:hypothetical protein n=1 Tax=Amycolatopsis sp. H20-H5 TaxID=3046309 RepID=UPI002DBE6BEE|nr:hypothetical protein [Amycolatopsis sp. H20-H5]MEC3982330.1 hypothetical protein [Amycolatopsis sp. H20-H5]